MTARFILQELPSGDIVDWAVPLSGAVPTETLSGPRALSGSLPLAYPVPVLEWGHAIWLEDDGVIQGGGIVSDVDDDGQHHTVTCVGFTGYLRKLPWLAPAEDLVQVDPLDIVRQVWTHVQGQPGGDLHVTVDPATSPIRIGEEEKQVDFTTSSGEAVAFDAGPFRLNAVDAQDLQKVIDDLAADTPFDYREHTYWDGERIRHRLELGHPALGAERPDLRFVIGENVAVLPHLNGDAAAYASEVLVIGAGEGRAAVTAHVPSDSVSRLRRVAIVADKTLRSATAATNRARAELKARDPRGALSELVVIDHPNAPLGSYDVGDTIHVTGPLYDGNRVDHWARITEIARPVGHAGRATLSLVPATR